MRTHTVGEATRLRARRKNYHLRVEIQNAAGAWVDYSNAFGVNWLRSLKWDDSIERRVMQGTLTLLREDRGRDITLAPTMTASSANIGGAGILEGRGIRLYGAVTAAGVDPVLDDWHEFLRGEIDDVEYGKKAPNMQVGFRDIGARVLDCFINAERTYGSAGGVPVDTVMQQMIDDNWNAASGPAPVLYVPTPLDSSFAVSPVYKQSQKSLLEALNDLAQQFGMVVRYKYDALGAFRLTLYDPQRTKSVPDAAFARGEYMEVATLRRSRDDVRNQILTLYRDAAGVLQSYYEEDAVSIAAYGPRFAQFGLNITSQIRTAAKAQAFTQAALSDLSTPLSDHQVELPLYWPAELGDLYTWAANDRQYNNPQNLAVVGWSHEWTAAGKARTRLLTSGRVKGAVKQWINKGGPIALDYFAPELQPRVVYDDDTKSADLYLTVTNNGNESIGVKVTDEAATAIAVLCKSDVDPAPRFVVTGTEIGPDDYFYVEGTGQIQRLNDLPLQDFRSTLWFVKAYGQASGLESPWLTITLRQAIPLPALQSAAVTPSQPAKLGLSYSIVITVTITGGVNIQSCGIRVVDIAADPALAIVDAVDIVPGQTITRTYPILASAAEVLGKTWGAYLKPNSKPVGYTGPPASLDGIEILVTSTGDTIVSANQDDMEAVQADVTTVQGQVTGLAGAQFLVSAASADLTAERVVADSTTVAWDFGTGGVALAYVPDSGITTAKLGAGAVTTAKIANEAVTPAKVQASGTTPSADKVWFGDGRWGAAQVTGTTGPVQVQQTITKVTNSLADGAGQTILLDIAPTVAFQEVIADAGAWVRVYSTLAALNADIGRSYAVDPVPGAAGEPVFEVGPGIGGWSLNTALLRNRVSHNRDTTRIGRFYMRVVNKAGSTGARTITIKYLPLEGIPTAAPADVTTGMLYRFDAQALTGYANNDPIGTPPNYGSVGGVFANGQGTPSLQAKYKTGQLNGFPGVDFTMVGGNTRAIYCPSAPAMPAESHLFVVCKPIGGGVVGSFGGGTTNATSLPSTSGGNVNDQHNSTALRTFALGVDPSGGLLYHSHGATGLWEAYTGLTQRFTTASNTGGTAGAQWSVGGWLAGGAFAETFNGILCELRFYSGALSADDVLGIKLSMATYWGLSL